MNNVHNDASALKQRLPEYLRAIGHAPRSSSSQSKFYALCPLHNDNTPSFSADLKENGWLWFCFACGIGGDIIDLHARLNNLDPKSNFSAICNGIIAKLGCPTATQVPNTPTEVTEDSNEDKSLSCEEMDVLTLPWRKALIEDDTNRERFASNLGLPGWLLKQAARNPPNDAMGIVPAGFRLQRRDGSSAWLREQRLAYIGDGYYKIREPFGPAGSRRFWMVGRPRRPWLSYWLVHESSHIKHVHIHESESSALALIASGLFNIESAGSIVVATGGAGGFRREWANMFSGQIVHFWPDADPAGARFVETTAQRLHGTAKAILIHAWTPPSLLS